MVKEIFCEFIKANNRNIRFCSIRDEEINPDHDFRLKTANSVVRQTHTVTGLQFRNCNFSIIPNPKILTNYFTCLEFLDLRACGIKKLEREQMKHFVALKEIHLNDNLIEFLSADLFIDNKYLEVLILSNNQLKYIEPEVFDYTKKLTNVDLSNNVNIDIIYAKGSNITLKQFKNEIRLKCQPDWKIIHEQFKDSVEEKEQKKMFEIRELNAAKKELEKKISDLTIQKSEAEKKIEKLTKKVEEISQNQSKKSQETLKSILNDENFKDFTIKIKDKNFKVHKIIIAAHSSLIAEILNDRPEIESLNFEDFDPETFKIILDFIYDKNIENEQKNFIEILKISGKLKIKNLMEISAEKLIQEATPKNSFEILLLANKYDLEELRQKAFDEFKKNFPNKNLKPDLASQTDKLRKLVEIKRLMDEIVDDEEE
ncbi:hypothetical protein PVAND_016866 [Polypedilum vanderplanki]|uniref:BTB domain-containing protein n=1 Tax=Polypedilum vanderplanki TaxID=319348 RepID=A0A9J6BH21_POLVA|nr:hypothetical protein PVAND_016866 [Polypedilum vanderplanki]